jgi:transposase
MVKELLEVEHLRQIPGVGPVVATYFVLTIDDPNRFRHSRDVASFFGLRPSMRESASVSHFGRITMSSRLSARSVLTYVGGAYRMPSPLRSVSYQLSCRLRNLAPAIITFIRVRTC